MWSGITLSPDRSRRSRLGVMTAARTWAVGIAVVALTVTALVVEYLARSSGFWVTATEVAGILV